MFGDIVQIINDAQGQGTTVAQRVQQRRQRLIELIAQEYPDKKGTVFLCAPIEPDHATFLQDSSFWYFSAISEPATVLTFGFQEPTTLYQPFFGDVREKWVQAVDVVYEHTKQLYGIDELKHTGSRLATYTVDPYFAPADYQQVIEYLQDMVARKQYIFTLYPTHTRSYAHVRYVFDRLALFVPGLMQYVVDISALVTKLRRKKDMYEIEMMYQSIAITNAAFQAAAHVIRPDGLESEVQAAIEYIFTENKAGRAYPSIVASGKRSTVLHYNVNNETLLAGDVVLIDAGAMYQHYCADITRVFPVSGTFSKRQKELYEIVLETQMHVVDHVQPGMWLSNPDKPDMSLQHIALNFLKQYGYDQYFIHGIGHHLGLDVHDVGSRSEPLAEGDVITIEPGIYIPQEGIGIRIEDNYWVIADSDPVCMSEDIPKTIDAIEEIVQQKFEM
ncbi:M24 family metallopeptidase [Candidatus Babeliales bacterium]|nr:M24 family metallopeptidase [Candidatus Babeliales bacterium]